MSRPTIPKPIETQILTLSKRRCCLCSGIKNNYDERKGQIAHLDKNPKNNKIDNLAWLCLDHHTEFDSTTSQHKNYTRNEVKKHRLELYQYYKSGERINSEPLYCAEFDGMFNYIYLESDDFHTLEEFKLELIFKLISLAKSGYLLTIDSFDKEVFYGLYFYSSNSKSPEELHLMYIDRKEKIRKTITKISMNTLDWAKLTLEFQSGVFKITLAEQETSADSVHDEFTLNKIQLAGHGYWDRQFSSIACYISYFSIKNDKDSIVKELIFDHGEEYLLKSLNMEEIGLVNAPDLNCIWKK